MLRRFALLLLAPCAAPTAALVSEPVDESRQPAVQMAVSEEKVSVDAVRRSHAIVRLTRRCVSPVVKAFDSFRASIEPQQESEFVASTLAVMVPLVGEELEAVLVEPKPIQLDSLVPSTSLLRASASEVYYCDTIRLLI